MWSKGNSKGQQVWTHATSMGNTKSVKQKGRWTRDWTDISYLWTPDQNHSQHPLGRAQKVISKESVAAGDRSRTIFTSDTRVYLWTETGVIIFPIYIYDQALLQLKALKATEWTFDLRWLNLVTKQSTRTRLCESEMIPPHCLSVSSKKIWSTSGLIEFSVSVCCMEAWSWENELLRANSYWQNDELCSHFTSFVLNLVSCISCSAFHWPDKFDKSILGSVFCWETCGNDEISGWQTKLLSLMLPILKQTPSTRIQQRHCFSG